MDKQRLALADHAAHLLPLIRIPLKLRVHAWRLFGLRLE